MQLEAMRKKIYSAMMSELYDFLRKKPEPLDSFIGSEPSTNF
jgi:hypothetical protein